MAGYVPFALLKKCRRQERELAAKFFEGMRKEQKETPEFLVEHCYAKFDEVNSSSQWLQRMSRGSLFEVKDDVFTFFLSLESEVRVHLSDHLRLSRTTNVIPYLLASGAISNSWCPLA